jgi:uncharacterized membrane protein (UPF0127 family)
VRRNAGLFGAALFFFVLQSCAAAGGGSGGDEKPQGRLATTALTILRSDGSAAEVVAEIARTDGQRSRGLMGRKTLAGGEGMLFVFETDRILSFWMTNTLLPLSIAYISHDGRILEIHDMEPLSTRSVQSTRSARYALEVPQGWFANAGIGPGDTVSGIPRL